ncbi:DUF4292 domain-containing protein [Mariniflexile ostreae]|uniref:DUF4292 domain-containing protein n=1 Tax=Mariniflexile ostreae TaxID=1520892 RepID=A0ABV5F766_9FLAO
MFSNKHLIYIFLAGFLVFGCKSTRTIAPGEKNLNLSTKQVVKEHLKQTPEFKTLASRVRIDIADGEKSSGYTVNVRVEKDKQILLMSTPISIVKALITPEKLSFYNKLDNTYFEGDFKYLSDLLGTELDFQKIQNLLIGEALYDVSDRNYKASVLEETYVLEPKKQLELFELFLIMDPSIFKLKSQQITQLKTFRHLQIDYLSHQEVEKQVFPEKIKVMAVEGEKEMIIKLEFKSISLNEDLRFPFSIPSGYNLIELK